MSDPVALLYKRIHGHDIFVIVIPDAFEQPVFTVFRFLARQNGVGGLDVAIIHIRATQDKVTFNFTNAADSGFVLFHGAK